MTIDRDYYMVEAQDLSRPNDIYNLRYNEAALPIEQYAARSFVARIHGADDDIEKRLRDVIEIAFRQIRTCETLVNRPILFFASSGWRFNNVMNRHRRLWKSSKMLEFVYESVGQSSQEVSFFRDENIQYAALATIPYDTVVLLADWLRMKQCGFLMLPSNEIDFTEDFVRQLFRMTFGESLLVIDWSRAIPWICDMDAVLLRCNGEYDDMEVSIDMFYRPDDIFFA